MTPLLGFSPDIDQTTKGVITDCANLIPAENGMQGSPSPVVPAGVPALAAECRGAAVVTLLSGSRRVLAGAQTNLYELSGTAWTDVSRAGNYTGSTENRWSFAQFGNATIAANDTEVLQASVTSGAFADIATAPKARIIIAVGNFLIALNTSDGTFGDSPDRWWCCAINDHTSWTPSVTTQANTGRLIGLGGELTAGASLGSNAIAFKARSMFLGTYVGSPVVWDWYQLPGEVGCIGPEAVCEANGVLVFRGEDDFYLFDGTRPLAIGGAIRQWFNSNASQTHRFRTQAAYDRNSNRVWFFFPSQGSGGACDRVLVYHVKTGQWGRADRQIEAVLNYVSVGLTFDSIGTAYATWDDLPNIPYDSQFWFAGGRVFSVFDTTHQLVNMIGSSTTSEMTTGDIGDDDGVSFVRRVRLRFLITPGSATVRGFTKPVAGNTLMPGALGVLSDGGFDIRQSARWHRFAFAFSGQMLTNAIRLDGSPEGLR